MEKQFKKGDLIIYVNGDRYEIGKVKRVCDDGCFVYYHSGETASKTPYDCMHPILNARDILRTDLGGCHGEKGDDIADVDRKKDTAAGV